MVLHLAIDVVAYLTRRERGGRKLFILFIKVNNLC